MSVSNEEVRRWLSRISSRFFHVPYLALLYFKNDLRAAVFMSYLLSLHELLKAERRGGWFYRASRIIEAEIGFSKEQQRRTIRKLVDLGFIEVEQRGYLGSRTFKIDYIAWERALDTVTEQYLDNEELMDKLPPEELTEDYDDLFDDDENDEN